MGWVVSSAIPSAVSATPMIVAIGASAGGLEACRQFLEALPPATGLAFIIVQHLDPTHESLLVELLGSHTSLAVSQASNGTRIEAEHLYIIPPGAALAVRQGVLRLSPPAERHGARLPFDFLLRSLAEGAAGRNMAVILSGSGEDGTKGALALRARGGFVIAQEPTEAGFDGMPRAAIAAGATDLVLPIAAMAAALLARAKRPPDPGEDGPLDAIMTLLRSRTGHDFSLYKPGTMLRRIERRMGMAGSRDLAAYLAMLERDAAEAAQLAKDLLIHVTGFFRDPAVFELLSSRIIPDLLAAHPAGQPIRIWVAGCSTGEETWSLAMLFREAIAASGQEIRLQIFASDKDAEAVATARQARYPLSISGDVTQPRLARFFLREEDAWAVGPELRGLVVFTVQDVLADPPFSKLDFVSCRNLLIYLKPPAQARVVAMFHFALRPGGILLLGASEALGQGEPAFTMLAKAERIWRRGEREKTPAAPPWIPTGDGVRPTPRGALATRQDRLAELCRRLVLQYHAPAAVLLDAQARCLHSLGNTDRYLLHPPGAATQELLSVARPALRVRLRAALALVKALGGMAPVVDGRQAPILELRPITDGGERLLLLSFIEPGPVLNGPPRGKTAERPRIAALQLELETTRAELRGAIQALEFSAEDQRAVNEEALSVNEEYQSTNEELLTSKEELQSLNEELTALNGQLQETLEHARTMSNDLQNVLYSTDVATLFLDTQLRIRFFTPATRALFSVLPGDIGRPLADLRSLAIDTTLLDDAASVLAGSAEHVQEIATPADAWYSRRVLPYRGQDGAVEGVVITFTDITARRRTTQALREATALAERASAAKTRFLSAASHDLRQPLQTLTLLQGLLARGVTEGEPAQLVAMLEPTLAAMSGMLNTLLDINQIDDGTMQAAPVDFALGPLLERLAREFGYLAEARGLALRAVPCSLAIRSDPHMLEQVLRNLLSNALKYTCAGRVLLGCRRQGKKLRIEIWDTGVGIAEHELGVILEEFHQLDNAARQREKGLGLGLSIVRRFADALGHRLTVRSRPGHGSVFAIAIPLASLTTEPERAAAAPIARRTGTILVVEDDPDLRALLVRMLEAEGHHCLAAADGDAALALDALRGLRPDLLLTDHNLPGALDGPHLAGALRARFGEALPVVILTGEVTMTALREFARLECELLHKPVKAHDLIAVLQRMLPPPGPPATPAAQAALIHLVDDDGPLRAALRLALEAEGHAVAEHGSAEAFLESYQPGTAACLLLDGKLPGISGVALLARLRAGGDAVPAILMTGFSDVQSAVAAMRAGASDFIEKPMHAAALLGCIARAMERATDHGKLAAWHEDAAQRIALLTPRQHAVMQRVLAGEPSKNIASDLGISQRTVEAHRAAIMRRTGATSLPALARLAVAATP